MAGRPKIGVIGSSNMDLVSYAPRLPRPGETIVGGRFATFQGGKGANQAVMAARLGAQVDFIARVGDDAFGREMLASFKREGMDVSRVQVSLDTPTGTAAILVDSASGENCIVVADGANGLLSAADVEAAGDALASADVVVCQWECPLEASLAGLRIAKAAGARTIFNPAPARSDPPAELFTLVDVLCPNQDEAARLSGRPADTPEQASDAARALLDRGAGAVVVTLGERGALLADADGQRRAEGLAVRAVDATGAGDAFVGALAVCLAAGMPLDAAAHHANQLAAISVQSEGAQASYPHRDDLPEALRLAFSLP